MVSNVVISLKELSGDESSQGDIVFGKGCEFTVLDTYEDFLKIKSTGICDEEFWIKSQYVSELEVDDINAKIQAALNPSAYLNLTDFNREPSYKGGGYRK